MTKSNKPFVPWGTLGLLILHVSVFIWELKAANVGLLGFVIQDYDFNWVDFIENPLRTAPTLLSYTFFHADVSHLISNLIFLLLFSAAVERVIHTIRYVGAYFMWGAFAALVQGFFSPFSNGLIGASGAISGVAGAFFVLFPLQTPSHFWAFWLGPWIRKIPAFFWIGIWFLDQLRLGFLFLLPDQLHGQISLIGYWAHIGGFGLGALSMVPFILRDRENNPKN